MEAPIEEHGLDDQLVAGCILAFKFEHPSLVPPEGRYEHGQLHIGQAGQLFQLLLVGADHARLGDHQDAHEATSL